MDKQNDDTITSRRRELENITFEGITKLCAGAGFDTIGKTPRELKIWLTNNSHVSLELGGAYTKTQPSVFVSVRRPVTTPSIADDITSSSADVSRDIDDVEQNIEEVPMDNILEFRVPLSTTPSTSSGKPKKILWIVIRGASTFLGAFPTRRSVAVALHKNYPDIDVSEFESEEGYDNVRLVSFDSEKLLDDMV